jgi:hypothetical protein
VRYHFRSYLDETGKGRLQAPKPGNVPKSVLGRMVAPVVSGVNVPQGFNRVILPVGYLRGQLTAGGFLKDRLVLSGLPRRTGRNALEKSRWIDSVSREWTKALSRYRSYSEKGVLSRNNFALSLAGDISRRLTLANVSAPLFLEKVLERSFARYLEEQGYDADDSLGYVYGFHMDTNNLHIQMSVFPRTRKGKLVRVTKMVRSDMKTESFLSNMTRYACDAANDLERELFGKPLAARPIVEFGKSLFRAHRVFGLYQEVLRKGKNETYQALEENLVNGFVKSVAVSGAGIPRNKLEEMMPSLFRVVRRYAGANEEQAKAPVNYDSDDAGVLLRRMSRLWLAWMYEEQEALEAAAQAKKQIEAKGSFPGFPDTLVPVYMDFWKRALGDGGRLGSIGREVSEHLQRRRESAALDIQKELPEDMEQWREDFQDLGDWFDKFVLYLDEKLLFGSGVFYSNAGLKELELAVRMRVCGARFLMKDALGVPSVKADKNKPGRVVESKSDEPASPDLEGHDNLDLGGHGSV